MNCPVPPPLTSPQLPPSFRYLVNFGIRAFTWFSRKIWQHFYLWSDKFPSFHPGPLRCRSVEVLQCFSSIPQNQVISPPAGPGSTFTVRLCLRWHGYCSWCKSAWRPALQREKCRQRQREEVRSATGEIQMGVKLKSFQAGCYVSSLVRVHLNWNVSFVKMNTQELTVMLNKGL